MDANGNDFQMRLRMHQDVYVIVFQGELDMYNSHRARNALQGVMDRGARKLVLNLSRVSYIDSSGIGILLYCHMMTRKTERELRIVGMNRKVLRVMELTKLLGVLPIADSEQEAVASLAAGGTRRSPPGPA